MCDLTAEDLALAPSWATHYITTHQYPVDRSVWFLTRDRLCTKQGFMVSLTRESLNTYFEGLYKDSINMGEINLQLENE